MSEVPTKTVPIDSISPHPENYNQHPESQIVELVESAESFGQYKNVVTWSPDSEIDLGNGQKLYPDVSYLLAGHGFWLASRRAGRDTIEVKDYTGLPYEDALMLMQIDNAAPLGAQPDPEKLKALLQKTRERAVDRPKLGAMLARLRESAGVSENGEGAKDAPDPQVDKAAELQEKWGTRLGQVWTLDEHRLAVGDCTDKAVVEAAMRGERADACIADPPYGINFDTNYTRFTTGFNVPGTNHKPIANDDKPFDPTPYLDYQSVVLWGANYFADKLPLGTWLIWDKRFKNGEALLSDAELAWMKTGYGVYIFSLTSQGFVRPEKIQHPTQKPVNLIQWCIEKSKAGEIVYDPFSGSGTTLIACEQLKRKCRAIEIDPVYCAVAIQRWVDLTRQDPVLLSE